jgi:anti-sigma factor RsiW
MMAQAHPIAKEDVMAYLDGELPPQRASRVAEHIADCSGCRALVAQLRGISSNLLAWNVEPAPDVVTYGVKAVLRAESVRSGRDQGRMFGGSPDIFRRVISSRSLWAGVCAALALAIVLKISAPDMRQYSGPESAQLAQPAPPATAASTDKVMQAGSGGEEEQVISGPLIARTAALTISVKDLAATRGRLDAILRARGGYVANITINTEKDEPASLNAEAHIPADVCDAALADLRALGHVEQEQQGSEEVTSQVVDLNLRLKNARLTESTLEDILRTRAGKLSDVLDVEKEMANVRGDIERMEGEQKALNSRVAYASIQLTLNQEYAASLGVDSASFGRRLRNAVVDGFHAAADLMISVSLLLLYAAPSVILAAIILFWPARWGWRRLRKAH